jgi:ribosome modulation factor
MTEIKSDREKMREDGYQAGLRGLELEECPLWGKAWGPVKGTNAPAYLIAGWIAGNAMWLHAKKLAGEEPKPPVSLHDQPPTYDQLLSENFELSVHLSWLRGVLDRAQWHLRTVFPQTQNVINSHITLYKTFFLD